MNETTHEGERVERLLLPLVSREIGREKVSPDFRVAWKSWVTFHSLVSRLKKSGHAWDKMERNEIRKSRDWARKSWVMARAKWKGTG